MEAVPWAGLVALGIKLEGQSLDLEVEFRAWSGTAIGLRFFVGEGEETLLTWEPKTGWLTLDRTNGGLPIASKSATHPDGNVFRGRVEASEGLLSLRVILDRSAVEVFAQNGTTTLSATVYPKGSSRGVEFFSTGGSAEVVCRAWELKL